MSDELVVGIIVAMFVLGPPIWDRAWRRVAQWANEGDETWIDETWI